MPKTVKTPLGPPTLNRKWYLDVNTGTEQAPVWTGVFGVKELTPALAQTMQDDGDFDSGGYGSDTITQQKWSIALKLQRKVSAAAPDEYDPGQETLRLTGSEIGQANRVHCRWYEVNDEGGEPGPQAEAYEGHASVSWNPDGGDQTALSTVAATLNGQGKRIEIEHPDAT